MAVTTEVERKRPGMLPWVGDLSLLPWWMLVVAIVGGASILAIVTIRHWRAVFDFPGGRRFHFTDPGGHELAVWSDR